MRLSHIRYESEPDDWVPAIVLETESPIASGGRPGAVALHQTTRVGKREPAGLAGLETLHYGLELAARGFAVIAPDYPGFGDYETDPYASGYRSTTMKGIVNHMRAVDLLSTRHGVAPSRIASVGHSLGGHNALFVAAFDARIGAVVSSCGFTAFSAYKGGDLSGWSSEKYMPLIATEFGNDPERMPFDFTDILEAIAPTAVFINAPVDDDNFDVEGVRRCVDIARSACRRSRIGFDVIAVHPDTGHEFPDETREQAYEFLDSRLGGSASR